jgi:dipeptidyl aminopeptidase/acylaminoacyl peptidase
MEEVAFRTSDGLTLRGWYAPSRNGAAVILVHGGAGNRASLLTEAQHLAARGFGVLTFDRRANGESDGETTTWGVQEPRDVAAALDFVSARADVDAARIGVVGFSIGASAVAMQASRDRRAAAVLLLAVWPSLEEEVRYKARRFGPLSALPALWAFRHAGLDVDEVRPVPALAAVAPRPLMLVGGTEDADTPPAIMERVHAAAAGSTLWIVPGAHHGDYAKASPEEYPRRFVAFFESALVEPGRVAHVAR